MKRRWRGGGLAPLALLLSCTPKAAIPLAIAHSPTPGAGPTAAATPAPTASAASGSITTTENGGKTEVHAQDVVATESWDAEHVHLVQGTVHVDDLLTIAPGATVDFLPGADLVIAPAGTGRLVATGSPGLPITFDSAAASPSAGDWCGIDVGSAAPLPSGAAGGSCVLDRVVIAHGGQGRAGQPAPPPGQGWAAVHAFGGTTIAITNSTLSASAGDGLQVDVATPRRVAVTGFGHDAFLDNAGYPIEIDPNLVGQLDPATTFSGDGTESVRFLALGGEMTEIRATQTWPKLTRDGNPWHADVVPYSWPFALSSLEGKETLDPGVQVLFDVHGLMRMYEFGQIYAMGTQQDPVVFDSVNSLAGTAKAGDWVGLRFLCCQDELHDVYIRHAGYGGLNGMYNEADLGIGNPAGSQTVVTLDNVFLQDGSGAGLAYDANTLLLSDTVTIDPHPGGATESVTWY